MTLDHRLQWHLVINYSLSPVYHEISAVLTNVLQIICHARQHHLWVMICGTEAPVKRISITNSRAWQQKSLEYLPDAAGCCGNQWVDGWYRIIAGLWTRLGFQHSVWSWTSLQRNEVWDKLIYHIFIWLCCAYTGIQNVRKKRRGPFSFIICHIAFLSFHMSKCSPILGACDQKPTAFPQELNLHTNCWLPGGKGFWFYDINSQLGPPYGSSYTILNSFAHIGLHAQLAAIPWF